MPTIEDTSQASAIALQQCLETVPDNEGAVIVSGQGAGFLVDQATYDCWATKDLETMVAPDCQSSPCYVDACAEPVPPPPTVTSFAPTTVAVGAGDTTFTATGTNIVAPVSVTYLGAAQATVAGTVVDPQHFTWVIPASQFVAPTTIAWIAEVAGVDIDLGDNNLIAVA